MAFALAKEQEAFIDRMVHQGRFNNQSEVVREALRRMEREETSYLNPEPLTPEEAARIYAPNPEEDAREVAMARGSYALDTEREAQEVKAWELWKADLGHGLHPVVIVSHPLRAANKAVVEVIDCTSQRAGRPPDRHEVLLDKADGMDWETLCKCDCIYAVQKTELRDYRGQVTLERRRQIVRTIVTAHDWEHL